MPVLLRPPMLLLHVLAAIAVGLAATLGWWQVSVWKDHRADKAAQTAQLDPVPLGDLIGADDPFPREGVGRPVEFTGSWDADESVFVEGRLHDGDIGFWMVTPFVVCPTTDECAGSAMPVVVGWTPTVEEAPAPPRGATAVTGWLQPAEPAAEIDATPDDNVLPALRIADLLERSEVDLYGAYVILNEPADARGSLVTVTPDSFPEPPAFTGLRNLLYGFEWWFFGGFAIFLWVRWCRDELMESRLPSEA